ncbi:LpqN/LpqT family lipoprotein [Mycobacterium sp. NPDC048908]|uniref:LpqN/LpqT family lipoprotein n=1 Tax=Mycobacterium sp. NPDC048908 TaxID=3364292 RepID=UPI00371DC517
MKRTAITATAAAMAIALSGCGSAAKTEPVVSMSPKPSAGSSTSAKGPHPTIASYIAENSIQETPVKRGDSGSPTIDLTPPPGWQDGGSDTPDWAYGALVYKGPNTGDHTPSITAVMSKLTGNVDTQKIIDLAPGELENLPGWTPTDTGQRSTLGNYPAFQLSGTWTQDGETKVVAQKTVVVPGKGGLYVLQLNADGVVAEKEIIRAATDIVDSDTKIKA